MRLDDILSYCLSHLQDVVFVESWGECGIFYNPHNVLKRGIYVLTIKEKDGAHDKASILDREGIYRVNVGLKMETFIKLFGYLPKRPKAGEVVEMPFDFTATNIIMPHPIYAWMGWVCVLNPSNETFDDFKAMIQESYAFAKEKFAKRKITVKKAI